MKKGKWIYWNRRMWVFCLILAQVACCDDECGWVGNIPFIGYILLDLCYLVEDITGFYAAPMASHGPIEENRGQAPPTYRFYLPGPNGPTLFSDEAVTFHLGHGLRVRLSLDGAAPAQVEPEELQVTKVNYLFGKDPAKWVRDARTFGQVRYRSVYPGIDMVFHGVASKSAALETGELEQDFILAQGADPDRIRMRFDGADKFELDKDGSLNVHAGKRQGHWHPPVVYQKVDGGRREVRAAYKVRADGTVGFALGSYRPDRPLVIDPVISFSSYAGTAGNDAPGRVVVDATGNTYVVGSTNDPAYPASAGAFTINTPGGTDLGATSATLTKIDPTGSKALYITHFGGSMQTYATGIALDASGNIYIVGSTNTGDFPTTPGSAQSTIGSNDKSAAFIVKLDPAGDQLLYGSYLNGSGLEAALAVTVDAKGSAYVGGITSSTDFPVTGGAFQTTFKPVYTGIGVHGFLSKLSPDGSHFVYSTFFGGGGGDFITSLALDAKNNLFVTGATTSPDFPVTQGALSATYGGSSTTGQVNFGDAFVAKLNASGTALIYATYLGGKLDDAGTAIAVDADGNAYVTGSTMSPDFPTTAGALQTKYGGTGGETNFPTGDAFVAKLNPAGTALLYSTYLGGSRDDRAWALSLNSDGSVWVGGHTLSKDFPLTADAHQPVYGGERAGEMITLGDAFIARLDPLGATLQYSSYHGGSGNDAIFGLAATPDGGILASGITSSNDIKAITKGAYQTRPYGGNGSLSPMIDQFFFKLSPPPPMVTVSSIANEASGAVGSVSPGMVVSITGTNLADAPNSADLTQASLPFVLGTTTVLFDGTAAALISVSPTQIVAVAPYELQPGATTQVVVNWNGILSAATTLTVIDADPGLYAGSLVNIDGTSNSDSNPADFDSTITINGTGEGLLNPTVADGTIITADSVPTPVLPVTATLGGNPVNVLAINSIAGQPAGRFQIQIMMPDPGTMDPGDYPLVVQVDASVSQSVTVSLGPPAGQGDRKRKNSRRR